MANIKSVKKDVVTSEKARVRNMGYRSAVKTAVRKVTDAIDAKNFDQAQELFVKAESVISKVGQKGIFKKNTASRKVSRLAATLRKAKEAAQA